MASASQSAFKSREEYKKSKELEEARKAGTALPAVDEDGNDINPHIPQYIAQAPWYLNPEGPTLKHQRNLLEERRNFDGVDTWYPRGRAARSKEAPTKFRPGACTNCGAMTHKAKDCFERPRKVGAKWTGKHLKSDDVVKTVHLNWESKRDRWNGYNPDDYRQVTQRYAAIEEERKKLRAERLDRELRDKPAGESGAGDDSDPDADFKPNDAGAVVIQQSGGAEGKNRVVARNLRIREDTAKYLYNLDVNSAYYDPKTRSMRSDPTPHIEPGDKDYAGDNFVRYTGDVAKLASMQLHALEAAEAGRVVPHLQAEPTRAEATFRQFEQKKKALDEMRRTHIMERYGGQEHSKPLPGMQGLEQSEAYVEYTRDGQIVRGKEVPRPTGAYPEDIYERNHTSIWGSYYKDDKWGYACCHQMSRSAYCTGEAGKQAAKTVEDNLAKRMKKFEEGRDQKIKEHEEAAEKRKRVKDGASEDAVTTAAERKKRRTVEQELRALERADKRFEPDDRKREFNSKFKGSGTDDGFEISEEAMEAYRLRRHVADDPMAKFLSNKDASKGH